MAEPAKARKGVASVANKPPSTWRAVKSFLKRNRYRLLSAAVFFLLPWAVNFVLFYELAVLVALIEIGGLLFYQRRKHH